MGRVIITAIIVAMIAAVAFYFLSRSQMAAHEAALHNDQQQITVLQQQISQLKSENEQLKSELAKVQAEQANLAAQNDALNKAIATYKSTGKMPALKLPYPPK